MFFLAILLEALRGGVVRSPDFGMVAFVGDVTFDIWNLLLLLVRRYEL